MRLEDMILVSVDDHVVEPADLFANHVTAAWKARVPRVVRKKDGSEVWVFEGTQVSNLALHAAAGRPPEDWGVEATHRAQLRPGAWDVHARIRDMNADGVLASLCFPSFPGLCGGLWSKTKDKGVSLVMLRAYNDWHRDEFCAAYPGRFIPIALPPLWDPKAMADEVRRMAKKGCHAVSFSENPEKLGLPGFHGDHWDPFWSACCDEDTIVCLHVGSGAGLIHGAMDAPIDVALTLQPYHTIANVADLLWSRTLRKFPGLRIAVVEAGIGWIPAFLERVDQVYRQHHAWTHQDFGALLPSDLFRERIVCSFTDDESGIANREEIGLENVVWGSNYPRAGTSWPRSPEHLARQLDGVPDTEVDQLTQLNALRHFRLDPFEFVDPDACRVGALRALAGDVDLSVSAKSRRAPGPDRAKPVTSQDVVRQLASAFASPTES
jgi:predicted TIM-barrel fold metal-dependent hydrolase